MTYPYMKIKSSAKKVNEEDQKESWRRRSWRQGKVGSPIEEDFNMGIIEASTKSKRLGFYCRARPETLRAMAFDKGSTEDERSVKLEWQGKTIRRTPYSAWNDWRQSRTNLDDLGEAGDTLVTSNLWVRV